jgi:hypothetical protein
MRKLKTSSLQLKQENTRVWFVDDVETSQITTHRLSIERCYKVEYSHLHRATGACEMRRRRITSWLAICAASLSAGCAAAGRFSPHLLQSPSGVQRAGAIPASWDKVVVLPPGSPVVVTLLDGDRVKGAFRTLGTDNLGLTDSAGRPLDVARSNIRRIVAQGTRDGLKNGVLIGAGIGLGTAAAVLAAAASGNGYILPSAKWGAPLLLSAGGGAIGIVVDRAHRHDQLIYVRP